jgi:hypothetical protein
MRIIKFRRASSLPPSPSPHWLAIVDPGANPPGSLFLNRKRNGLRLQPLAARHRRDLLSFPMPPMCRANLDKIARFSVDPATILPAASKF